eukprot:5204509-Alexandrium_andersonii.AAC.1
MPGAVFQCARAGRGRGAGPVAGPRAPASGLERAVFGGRHELGARGAVRVRRGAVRHQPPKCSARLRSGAFRRRLRAPR